MGEMIKRRPGEPGKVLVETPDGQRQGPDFNDTVRQIVWDLKDLYQWSSWTEAAAQLGIPRQTLVEFMEDTSGTGRKRGLSLASVSRMVAAHGGADPLAFFRLHPALRPKGRSAQSADKLGERLSPGQARKLEAIVRTLDERGALNQWLEAQRLSMGIPSSPRKGRRKSG